MLVKIFGGAVYGINAITITIEVNILWGAKFIIVGLPDNAVKESQQRIDSALREIGLKIPGKRVIINMAPADVKKEVRRTTCLSLSESLQQMNSYPPHNWINTSLWENCH